MSVQSVIQLLGGVGVFLFAIKLISDSLQLLAGDSLRRLIGILTRTPLLGVLVGTGVTVLIQSSSATTVMTVSFVDAGLMTLNQAIGVIMGANIGTTITGQILAIKVKDYAYLFVIMGVLLSFFCKSKRYQYLGNGLLGFGLLFVGMQTMESSMSFLRSRQDIFIAFSETPLMGLVAGTLLTLLVQSSSATVGLTIALGMQGLLPLDAAIPIILGDNIGTTITAVIASIGTERTARQACAAHVLFNLIGVCIFLPLMPVYIGFIESTSSAIGHQIANAHTLFNIANTLLFLPFVKPFANFIRRLIPDSQAPRSEEVLYLDPKLLEVSPVMAVEAVKNECTHMGSLTLDLVDRVEDVFFGNGDKRRTDIIMLEDKLDALHKALGAYAEAILRAGISDASAQALKAYVASAGDMERIGDNGRKLLDFYDYRQSREQDFSVEAMTELHAMFTDARNAVACAVHGLTGLSDEAQAESLAAKVRTTEAELRAVHVRRLGMGSCNPETGLVFIDVLGAIEHMAYRAKKIAQITQNAALPE